NTLPGRSERRLRLAGAAYTPTGERVHGRLRRAAAVFRRGDRAARPVQQALRAGDPRLAADALARGRGGERDPGRRADDRRPERDPGAAGQAGAYARRRRARVARVLIVGCGCRGRALARELRAAGHAVRGTTRDPANAAAIAAAGAEPYIGDPDRIGTLMDALHGVTILCWLMGTLAVPELHAGRLRMMFDKLGA